MLVGDLPTPSIKLPSIASNDKLVSDILVQEVATIAIKERGSAASELSASIDVWPTHIELSTRRDDLMTRIAKGRRTEGSIVEARVEQSKSISLGLYYLANCQSASCRSSVLNDVCRLYVSKVSHTYINSLAPNKF